MGHGHRRPLPPPAPPCGRPRHRRSAPLAHRGRRPARGRRRAGPGGRAFPGPVRHRHRARGRAGPPGPCAGAAPRPRHRIGQAVRQPDAGTGPARFGPRPRAPGARPVVRGRPHRQAAPRRAGHLRPAVPAFRPVRRSRVARRAGRARGAAPAGTAPAGRADAHAPLPRRAGTGAHRRRPVGGPAPRRAHGGRRALRRADRFAAPGGRSPPAGAVPVSGRLEWVEAEFGWRAAFDMGGQVWGVGGASLDEAFRALVCGAALRLRP